MTERLTITPGLAGGWWIKGSDPNVLSFFWDEETARRIVRAVNAHDALVEALALWQASDEEVDEGAKQIARQIAREKRDAALALAKGEPE